jgi:hypothetical protein
MHPPTVMTSVDRGKEPVADTRCGGNQSGEASRASQPALLPDPAKTAFDLDRASMDRYDRDQRTCAVRQRRADL